MQIDDPVATGHEPRPQSCALTFQAIDPVHASAGSDELVILPAPADQRQRRDLARLALEKGPEAFLKGEGPIARIVLPQYPTLDDMLAAEFLKRQLAGEPLPAGAAALAECARLIREGLRPGEVPPQRSPEAIFLAIVNNAGEDLTQWTTAEKFRGDWARMARRLMQAAVEDVDPFVVPLFDDAEFARERAFLARDEEVYRHDVARGEQWLVSLPDGPPRAAGLLLRQPKCLLFKHWARCDPAAPLGRGYLLLAVEWSEKEWVFSTDPVQRVSLQALYGEIQTAENVADPSRASDDSWFDGKSFDHTLVASPHRGTALPEKQVLGIVKRWAKAESVASGRTRSPSIVVMIAVAALLLATCGGYLLWQKPTGPAEVRAEPDPVPTPPPLPPHGLPTLHVLTIGVTKYDERRSGYFPCAGAANDARDLAAAFRQAGKGAFAKVDIEKPLIDELANKDSILKGIKNLRNKCAQNDIAVITFAGHGDTDPATGNQFYYVPFDFRLELEKKNAGVSRSDLEDYLKAFPCTVVVIVDTCHSGNAVALGERGFRRLDQKLNTEVEQCMNNLAKAGKTGVIVLAACVEVGAGYGDSDHGFLTNAVLDVLRGTMDQTIMPNQPGKVLTFADVCYYAQMRVPKLKAGQSVVVRPGGIALGDVPLGIFPAGGKAERAAAAGN